MRHRLFALAFAGLSALPSVAADPTPKEAVERIAKTGAEGSGNKEAALAWRSLVATGPDALPLILEAFEAASPVARNWLRTAADAIVQKIEDKAKWSGLLKAFVLESKTGPESRRLAFDELKRLDAKAVGTILPKLLEDKSTEIRREAISAKLNEFTAKKLEGDALKGELQTLFVVSRDQDQVEDIAKKLKPLGVEPDISKHFGVIKEWAFLGPLDGKEGKAYAEALPLESQTNIDMRAKHKGKGDIDIQWKPGKAKDELGTVDINTEVAKAKHAVAYAYTVVESDKERPVEVRLGSLVAVRAFLNGKEIFAREEYHHGQRHDQYIAKGVLKPGKNELLFKLVQNDQKEPWAQDWFFQARVCDDTGGALPIKYSVPETPKRD